jgi:N6-L-threonylcarbamoyladenine synthase
MYVLGLEATAHTFGCGIVNEEGVLSNVKSMYTTVTGGMIPVEVAKHHEQVADDVVKEALAKAGLSWDDINLISFSQGPGLAPCLLVGMRKAKELSLKFNKKLVGINHCVSHLTIGLQSTGAVDPVFVNVAGANTQIIALTGGYFRIFGETLDIGLGNALDKFGRSAGMGFPAGSAIEKLSLKGKFVSLPYVVKGMDLSFAGIVTKAERLLGEHKLEDVCFSLQEHAFAMLVEVTERAVAHTGKKEVLLIGGVAVNKRLQEMMQSMCKERGINCYTAPLAVAGDNGAMIAWQGLLQKDKKEKFIDILPYQRTDEVRVDWIIP